MSRLLIIGVDGACMDLVEPGMDAGWVPSLAALREQGASGVLETTLPPVSPAAWSTFATGTNPGKHGVLTFAQLMADSYEPVFVNASYRRGAAFWELAARQGISSGVFTVPCTYPPRPFEGFIVSGMLSPGVDRRMAEPPAVLDDLLRGKILSNAARV